MATFVKSERERKDAVKVHNAETAFKNFNFRNITKDNSKLAQKIAIDAISNAKDLTICTKGGFNLLHAAVYLAASTGDDVSLGNIITRAPNLPGLLAQKASVRDDNNSIHKETPYKYAVRLNPKVAEFLLTSLVTERTAQMAEALPTMSDGILSLISQFALTENEEKNPNTYKAITEGITRKNFAQREVERIKELAV